MIEISVRDTIYLSGSLLALFYCPGKGIPDNKKYFVGYHTLYGMEPKWSHSFFV